MPADLHRQFVRYLPWLLALAGMFLVLRGFGHPGLTWDEPFYIEAGRTYVKALTFSDRVAWREAWAVNHEHPPLAKIVYGSAGVLLGDRIGFFADRLPAILVYGALILVTYKLVRIHFRPLAAALAAGSLIAMPRVLGHAHLVGLDLPMTLAWTLAVYAFVRGVCSRRWAVAWGVLLGVAALVKINAVMLPVVLVPWALLYHGRRAVPNMVAMAIAPLVFVLGWPWLWPWHHADFLSRIGDFLSTGSDRFAVPVHYFGTTYHQYRALPLVTYPLAMTVLTAPVAVSIGAIVGAVRRKDITGSGRRGVGLYLVVVLGVLAIHSVPGVAKYDGVRLFLPVMPFVAALAGVGLSRIGRWGARRGRVTAGVLVLLGVVTLAPSVLWNGYGLTYYNAFAGWTRGADRLLGMEVSYWGEGLDQEVVDALRAEAEQRGRPVRVRFVGVGQLVQLYLFSPDRERPVAIYTRDNDNFDLLVVSNRKARFKTNEPPMTHADPKNLIYTRRLFDGTPLVWVYKR
jgi:4-amino-4-deoxy-L-arabinose transferase-like glycosyltransferase